MRIKSGYERRQERKHFRRFMFRGNSFGKRSPVFSIAEILAIFIGDGKKPRRYRGSFWVKKSARIVKTTTPA